MFKNFSISLITAVVSLVLNGCSLNQSSPAPQGQFAECPVCRANNDLGCMRVRIEEDTPRIQYKGQTFYFCSEECQRTFIEHPELYPAIP